MTRKKILTLLGVLAFCILLIVIIVSVFGNRKDTQSVFIEGFVADLQSNQIASAQKKLTDAARTSKTTNLVAKAKVIEGYTVSKITKNSIAQDKKTSSFEAVYSVLLVKKEQPISVVFTLTSKDGKTWYVSSFVIGNGPTKTNG
jgi:hypothetical protein